MKMCKGWLQALLSSAPRGFAARSRVLARPVLLAQTGELASRLPSLFITEEDWGGIATLGVGVARVKRRRQEMRKVLSLSLSLLPFCL